MIYQLPNGKVIEMSVEQYLDMSDDDFEYLMANNYGEEIEDPWFGSVLTSSKSFADVPPDILEDLTQVTDSEKLFSPDLDISGIEEE